MMLSSEVLPAPLGPMMARISPLRMSKETPLTALTPPKASDTFSTASSTSPATTSGPLGALMPRLRAPSPRLLHRWPRPPPNVPHPAPPANHPLPTPPHPHPL